MARGKASDLGTTRISQNGYHYTKTASGWRLTHHILAEQALGRPLRLGERVTFADADRTNLSPDNIIVSKKGSSSKRRQVTRIEDQIRELEAKKKQLLEES